MEKLLLEKGLAWMGDLEACSEGGRVMLLDATSQAAQGWAQRVFPSPGRLQEGEQPVVRLGRFPFWWDRWKRDKDVRELNGKAETSSRLIPRTPFETVNWLICYKSNFLIILSRYVFWSDIFIVCALHTCYSIWNESVLWFSGFGWV